MEHSEQYIKSRIAELLQAESTDYSQILALSNELAQSDKAHIRFTVDAGIINRLGKELVGKGETAISELIKNAYGSQLRTQRSKMSATEYAIGRHCGVTFAGLKIASLVSLRKGEEDVIQALSRRFAGKGFAFILLREDEERLLVYVCHKERLTKYLFSAEVRAFLSRFGYGYASAEEALEQLKRRMKDGFLRDPDGCILCGAWKVYENVGEAARTFERFRRCSACICRHMDRGRTLSQIFNVG